jgi:hypothetical protein
MVPPDPPAPIVMGKPVAVTVIVPAPSNGLAVYGVAGDLSSLNPPAPPPPPLTDPPPPPPPTTIYETVLLAAILERLETQNVPGLVNVCTLQAPQFTVLVDPPVADMNARPISVSSAF